MVFRKKIVDGVYVYDFNNFYIEKYGYLEKRNIVMEIDGVRYRKVFCYDKELGHFDVCWKRIADGKLGIIKPDSSFEIKDSLVEIDFKEFKKAVGDVLKANEELNRHIKEDFKNVKVKLGNIEVFTDVDVEYGIYFDVKCNGYDVVYIGDAPVVDDIENFIRAISEWYRIVHKKLIPKIREVEQKYGVELIMGDDEV